MRPYPSKCFTALPTLATEFSTRLSPLPPMPSVAADKSGFHDPVIKEQEQEAQVAADRYGQQNVSHAYCSIHARSLLRVKILHRNSGRKGSLSPLRTG